MSGAPHTVKKLNPKTKKKSPFFDKARDSVRPQLTGLLLKEAQAQGKQHDCQCPCFIPLTNLTRVFALWILPLLSSLVSHMIQNK